MATVISSPQLVEYDTHDLDRIGEPPEGAGGVWLAEPQAGTLAAAKLAMRRASVEGSGLESQWRDEDSRPRAWNGRFTSETNDRLPPSPTGSGWDEWA